MIRSKILFPFSLLLLIYLTSQSLNPFSKTMFGFQDPTQVGRVTSFAHNLKTWHIPPRLAPEFSFELGLPVFNFYAPTAYWITSYIALLGVSSTMAVKISFLLTIIFSFFGMYFLLKQLFNSDRLAAAVGASTYVTSTYFATEIVVRGNLSESWFLALLPISLGLLIKNSRSTHLSTQIITTLVLSLLFTSHNMMLLLAVPITLVFLCFFPNKKRNLISFSLALLIDSYFLIPAFLEGSWVQATTIAKEYDFSNHFICVKQLWTSNGWGFGGSLPGCDADTMSFKLGKMQIILGLLGFITFIIRTLKTKKYTSRDFALLFISLLSVSALFLTLYASEFIWKIFSPVMSLFQFPWRFLVFGMFGIATFSGYFCYKLRIPYRELILVGIMLALFLPARKYFIKPLTPLDEYEMQFNSEDYRQNHLAYKIPEYLVKNASLNYWRSVEPINTTDQNTIQLSAEGFQALPNADFQKMIFAESNQTTLPIHYFPYWKILINGQPVVPTSFDQLGKPIVETQPKDKILVYYQQTTIERIAVTLTAIGLIILFFGQWIMSQWNTVNSKTRLKIRLLFLSGIFILLRKPDSLLRPQLFAEEGVYWFAQSYQFGFIRPFFMTTAGYLHTISRIGASIAWFFPLQLTPIIYDFTALVAQLLPLVYLISGRLNKFLFPQRFFIFITYLLLTNSADTYLNITNAQWYVVLSVFSVLVAKPARTTIWITVDFLTLLIGGLSGPFSLFLLVPTFFLVYKKRLRINSLPVQMISLSAIIQALLLSISTNKFGTRLSSQLIPTVTDIYQIYSRQILWGLLAGPHGYDWLVKTVPFVQYFFLVTTIGSLFIFLYAAVKAVPEIKAFMVLACLIFFTSLFSISVSPDNQRSVLQVLAETSGMRYWLIPMICTLSVLVWASLQKNIFVHWGSLFLLSILVFFQLALILHPNQLKYDSYVDYHWPEQVADFNTLSKGESKKFLINPEGWSVTIVKK